MGYSTDATLAWGIYLGDEDELDDCFRDENYDLKWDDYKFNGRLEEEFPLVELDHAGTYEWSVRYLVVSSSRIWSYEGHTEIDLNALVPPTEEEIAQLNAYLDSFEYTGPREIKLHMFASYG